MKRLVWGVALAVLVLTLSTVVVWGSSLPYAGSTGASPADDALPKAVTQNGDEEEGRPFIGIAIAPLGKGKADELGVSGGVVVVRVLEDGPSAGILEKGDVIIAVNGEDVTGVRDVARAVRELEPGDVLVLEALRDGSSLTLEVTVGTGEVPQRLPALHRGLPQLKSHPLLRLIGPDLLRRVWSAEIVIGTDDGPKTVSVVAGTVASVDPDGNAITLTPKDGSGDTPYQLTDETVVIWRGHRVDLGRVKEGDAARVISVDGEVRLALVGPVKPGPRILPFSPGRFGMPVPGNNFRIFGDGPRIRLNLDRLCDSDILGHLPSGFPIECEGFGTSGPALGTGGSIGQTF